MSYLMLILMNVNLTRQEIAPKTSSHYITFLNRPELRHLALTLFILTLQSHATEQLRLHSTMRFVSWQRCAGNSLKNLLVLCDTRY